MRKIFSGLLGIAFIFFVFFQFLHTLSREVPKKINPSPTPNTSPAQKVVHTDVVSQVLFVPYWTLHDQLLDDSTYDSSMYFGISAGVDGIIQDDGFEKADDFLTHSQAGKKLLVIRMLDSEVNSKILSDAAIQKTVIDESISFADKGFDGVVLDLEISAIAFDSLVRQIRDFATDFASRVHNDNKLFYVTTYGDTFYRSRPFDISAIAKSSDGIMVMAYDFHKAKGDPGPNFPLSGKDNYGYDFETMIQDFLNHTSPQKLTVIFGMYGYDWTVNNKHDALSTAKSLSFLQMKQKFIDQCSLLDCNVQRDKISKETKVTYKEGDISHEVWFEDTESVNAKKAYLKSVGIDKVGYWAYSYF